MRVDAREIAPQERERKGRGAPHDGEPWSRQVVERRCHISGRRIPDPDDELGARGVWSRQVRPDGGVSPRALYPTDVEWATGCGQRSVPAAIPREEGEEAGDAGNDDGEENDDDAAEQAHIPLPAR